MIKVAITSFLLVGALVCLLFCEDFFARSSSELSERRGVEAEAVSHLSGANERSAAKVGPTSEFSGKDLESGSIASENPEPIPALNPLRESLERAIKGVDGATRSDVLVLSRLLDWDVYALCEKLEKSPNREIVFNILKAHISDDLKLESEESRIRFSYHDDLESRGEIRNLTDAELQGLSPSPGQYILDYGTIFLPEPFHRRAVIRLSDYPDLDAAIEARRSLRLDTRRRLMDLVI